MRSGRLFLIIGVVILLAALGVGAFLLLSGDGGEAPPVAEEEGTPGPPEGMTQVVVAANDIPRNRKITEGGGFVQLQEWPEGTVPQGAYRSLEAVYDRIARVEVLRGMVIVDTMLAEEPGRAVSTGSEASLQIPEGMVAYAMPIARYSSVAWALQPGDRVDVIISLLMVDLDEEFQSILPNEASCVTPSEEEGCQAGVMGRLEALPNGWVVNLTPSEGQRPRLVSQMTVQNLLVLQVGDWPESDAPPAPEAEIEQPEAGAGAQGEEAAPTTPQVKPVTLAVTRQDAVALDFAQATGARINFVLRPAGDDEQPSTESVTLEYLMERFNIELPPKVPYGVTPPISQLERIAESESAAQYGATTSSGGGEAEQ